MKNLNDRAQLEGWSLELECEFNSINQHQLLIRKTIEKKLRKLRVGGKPWSPTLQQHRNTIQVLSLLLKKRNGHQVSNRLIRRLLPKTNLQNAYHLSISELREKLNHTFLIYKKLDAEQLREDFLPDLARVRAERLELDYETELHRLQRIHQQRTLGRKIKHMRNKLYRPPTTQVFVTEHNQRRLVTSKEEIERVCINENDARFSQSSDTPLMQPPMSDLLGFLANTNTAEQILQGTFQPPENVDLYTKKMLQELRMPEKIRDLPTTSSTISTKEHIQSWNKQKESTASDAKSGVSFSHYIAGTQHPAIAEFDALNRSLPYQFGFSPKSWQTISDVEILKKAGVYDIEGMRTITLMNSEFNINNKKLGRDMMNHAEKHKLLAPEQYGGRKHHRSIIAALNKRLTMDLLRLRRQSGALCSNDAKSCYDRIVHSFASIAMRRLGAHPQAVTSMLSTLQTAKHHIVTAFGTSDTHFGQDRYPPLQGLGQGNGGAPAGWTAISTPLINMMRHSGFGINLLSALSTALLSFVCYAFVDDTDIAHCSTLQATAHEIIQEMQEVVDHWEGGLRTTGGALRVDKSFWYLIDFVWRNNQWHYATQTDSPGELSV